MKLCQYTFKNGEYKTDCGSLLVLRPTVKCDKCGRKSKEVPYATNHERQEDQESNEQVLR
jgi:hypothetical protein